MPRPLLTPFLSRYFHFGVHQQDRLMRIGEDIFYNAIAAARLRIRETVKQAIAFRVIDRVIQVAFFLMAKRFAVTYEKLKVTRVRLIDMRIINLVQDAVAQSEPNTATGVIRCAHAAVWRVPALESASTSGVWASTVKLP